VKSPQTQLTSLVIFVMLVGVAFAAFTQHVWEDYYITYRASKNLAQGNGLVFNVGEPIHTFTSPLGVLLPALASWVTGTNTDQAALWVFRIISLAFLACGAGFIFHLARKSGLPAIPALLAGAWLALDAKTLDFSINGMETGIWVAFLTYAIWAQLGGSKNWRHLGVAWAGLMWTRPDCFIHISLLALSGLIFMPGPAEDSRGKLFVGFLKGGLVTTALYLPWFVWAWVYYTTPVPHTVEAKGGFSVAVPVAEQLQRLVEMPLSFLGHYNSMGATFLPAYYELEGWHGAMIWLGRLAAGLVGIAWLLPRVSRPVRWLSLVFFGIHAYLTLVPYYPFPWYVPATIPFAILVWVGVIRDWTKLGEGNIARWRTQVGYGGLVATLVATTLVTGLVAIQMRAQQSLIEDGNRRLIGEHIREHAAEGDTVFTESLGYIGYFSGIRTFDFPGMSSPEMVTARELVGNDWRDLIDHLQPTWVVLRPHEIERLHNGTDWRITHSFDEVGVFDRRAEIEALAIPGRGYLKHDAVFHLFKRRERLTGEGDGWRGQSDFPINFTSTDWGGTFALNTDVEIYFDIPPEAGSVFLEIIPPVWQERTIYEDGVKFAAEVRDWPRGTPLQTFFINHGANEPSIGVKYTLPVDRGPDAQLRLVFTRKTWRNHDFVQLHLPRFETDQ